MEKSQIDEKKVEELVQLCLEKERQINARESKTRSLRKRDIVKKAAYWGLWYPIAFPYYMAKKAKTGISDSASQLTTHVSDLQKNRDPWAQNAPDMKNFKAVLMHWGIREKEVPQCIDGMKAQMVLFGALGLWGLYLLTGSTMGVLHGIPLVFIGTVICTTRLWRVQVLKRRRFVFFKDWFLWGLFSWVGPETPFSVAERLQEEKSYE